MNANTPPIMIYNHFQDKQLSALGFGAMRLPLRADKTVDRETVFAMVDYALANGINYFDTAFPYHDGLSEVILGARGLPIIVMEPVRGGALAHLGETAEQRLHAGLSAGHRHPRRPRRSRRPLRQIPQMVRDL